MKVLLDACVWKGALGELERAGHDTVWVGDWAGDPGDDEVLAAAHAQERVLVTLDKDFGELAVVQRIPHSGILRLVGCSAREQGHACSRLLALYGEQLQAGAVLTAYPDRVRIRPAA